MFNKGTCIRKTSQCSEDKHQVHPVSSIRLSVSTLLTHLPSVPMTFPRCPEFSALLQYPRTGWHELFMHVPRIGSLCGSLSLCCILSLLCFRVKPFIIGQRWSQRIGGQKSGDRRSYTKVVRLTSLPLQPCFLHLNAI